MSQIDNGKKIPNYIFSKTYGFIINDNGAVSFIRNISTTMFSVTGIGRKWADTII